MRLFEILTGWMGESFVRAYAWAPNEDTARRLFDERNQNPKYKIKEIRLLLDSATPAFCTKASDSGWEA